MCTIRFLSHVCVKDLHQSRNDLTKKMLSAGEIRWDHVISCLWNVIISAVKMMMWFMDTIYKMVVSQHIYIYISYCTVQVLFHSGDLLNTSGCCRTSLPQGTRKIEMGQNWSSPISAGEDPQAHDILLVLPSGKLT